MFPIIQNGTMEILYVLSIVSKHMATFALDIVFPFQCMRLVFKLFCTKTLLSSTKMYGKRY